MPYFKDAATPVDVADCGGVTDYEATGSSPRAGSRLLPSKERAAVLTAPPMTSG